MVAAEDESTDMLDFCLSGSLKELQSWGHEYLRSLSGHIAH